MNEEPKLISFTERQAMEIKNTLKHGIFAGAFIQFLETRKTDQIVNAELFSEDITKLLKREQALGAASNLNSLLEDFRNHVDNNTTTEKE